MPLDKKVNTLYAMVFSRFSRSEQVPIIKRIWSPFLSADKADTPISTVLKIWQGIYLT